MLRLALFLLLLGGCRQLLGLVDLPGDGGLGETDVASVPGDGPDAKAMDAFVPRIYRYKIMGAAFTGMDYPGHWDADALVSTTGSASTGTTTTTLCAGTNHWTATPPQISGTVDDALFVDQLYGIPTTTCHVPVVNATYDVTLLFGPLYYGGGANPACEFPTTDQIFDISLEGTVVATAYDLTTDSSGCVADGSTAHPVAKTYTNIVVTDGTLDVVLTAPASQASMISAIQIIEHP